MKKWLNSLILLSQRILLIDRLIIDAWVNTPISKPVNTDFPTNRTEFSTISIDRLVWLAYMKANEIIFERKFTDQENESFSSRQIWKCFFSFKLRYLHLYSMWRKYSKEILVACFVTPTTPQNWKSSCLFSKKKPIRILGVVYKMNVQLFSYRRIWRVFGVSRSSNPVLHVTHRWVPNSRTVGDVLAF